MNKDYSVIVFDLGNTLIKFDHNIAIKKLASRFSIDEKSAYELFFDSELSRSFEKGELSPQDFHDKMTLGLGIDIPYNEFMPIWNDIFWEDVSSCALARQLKKRYKLLLLSNINISHFEHIKSKFSIIDIFDELILSYKLGSMKPEKRIYDEVVKLSGGDRSKIIYIDDRDDLIKVASGYGIDSIRYEGRDGLVENLKGRGIRIS